MSDAGTPLTAPALAGSSVNVSLAPHGTAIIEAPNVGSLLQRYGQFSLPSGVYGYGVFRSSAPGRPDQEAVVPFSDAEATSNRLTWDETAFTSSVAIVNPSSTAATVAVTVWDANGNIIGTSSIYLLPNGKTESALRTLPGLAGMVGMRAQRNLRCPRGKEMWPYWDCVLARLPSHPFRRRFSSESGSPALLRSVLLAGEIETAAALGSDAITLEERRGIPLPDLGEACGRERITNLVSRPTDLFHSLRVSPPKAAFLYKPLAITPSPSAARQVAGYMDLGQDRFHDGLVSGFDIIAITSKHAGRNIRRATNRALCGPLCT